MPKVEEYFMGVLDRTLEFATLEHAHLFLQNNGSEPGVEHVIVND